MLIQRTALTQYEIWPTTLSLSGQGEPGIKTDFQQSKQKIIYYPIALGLANPTSFLNNMWRCSGSSADIFLIVAFRRTESWWQENGAKLIAQLLVLGKALAVMTAGSPQAFPLALDTSCYALGPAQPVPFQRRGRILLCSGWREKQINTQINVSSQPWLLTCLSSCRGVWLRARDAKVSWPHLSLMTNCVLWKAAGHRAWISNRLDCLVNCLGEAVSALPLRNTAHISMPECGTWLCHLT